MMKIPDKSEFGGKGNMPEKMNQGDWLNQCEEQGCIVSPTRPQSTRTFPNKFRTLWVIQHLR